MGERRWIGDIGERRKIDMRGSMTCVYRLRCQGDGGGDILSEGGGMVMWVGRGGGIVKWERVSPGRQRSGSIH